MATITGTLKRGNGAALSTTIRFWMPAGPGLNAAGNLVSRSIVMVATNPATGAFSATLQPGQWIATWPDGSQINRMAIGVPLLDGSYDIEDLVEGSPIISSPQVKWYEDVAEMIASDSRLYAEARLRNAYSGDGIISGWSRILKDSAEATGLVANQDNVLESTDGYSFWVRNWIAS